MTTTSNSEKLICSTQEKPLWLIYTTADYKCESDCISKKGYDCCGKCTELIVGPLPREKAWQLFLNETGDIGLMVYDQDPRLSSNNK